jgi:hypothetical protein
MFTVLSRISGPFADWITVTIPKPTYGDPLATFEALFLELAWPCIREVGKWQWRCPASTGGVIRLLEQRKWWVLSASGGALQALRGDGAFQTYLATICEFPHRVSRLDVAQDYALDGSIAVERAREHFLSGDAKFTRKAVRPSDVSALLASPAYAGASGRTTGTVYSHDPRKTRADVLCKVYDKRQEIFKNGQGDADPGPRTRVEMTFRGDFGVNLKDAEQPLRLYEHVAGLTLVDRVPGIQPWEPFMAELVFDKSSWDPMERLKWLVDNDPAFGLAWTIALDVFGGEELALEQFKVLMRNRGHRAENTRKLGAAALSVQPGASS